MPSYIFYKRKIYRSPIPNFKDVHTMEKVYPCLKRPITLILLHQSHMFANQLQSCGYSMIYSIIYKANDISLSHDQILNFQLPAIVIVVCPTSNST